MQLALRPYVTSGIALVGASVIAISPISPVTPDVHVPTISTSSVAVQLTASVDNPVDVFAPVFDQAGAVINGFIAQQAANPFPVLRQFIANQVESAAILRDYVEIVGRSLQVMVMNMPGVLGRGLQKSLAGDPATAFGDVLQGILLPAGSFVTELYRVYTVLQRPVAVLQELVAAAFTRPSNFILAVMTFGIPVIQQVIRSGQSIIDSVMTGDPVKMINAIQHGIADVASKGVTFAGGMLNQIKVIQTILTRAFSVRPPRLPNPTAASAVAALAAVESAPDTLVTDISSTAISELGGAGTQTVSLDSKAEAPETPATETPVEETPAAETPVEETPAAETPVEETPVDETPAAETPVDNEPSVDDDAAGSGNGATDLSGGNKVTPGQTHSNTKGSDSDGTDTDAPESPADDESAPSGANSGPATATGTGTGTGSDSSDSSDSGDSGSGDE